MMIRVTAPSRVTCTVSMIFSSAVETCSAASPAMMKPPRAHLRQGGFTGAASNFLMVIHGPCVIFIINLTFVRNRDPVMDHAATARADARSQDRPASGPASPDAGPGRGERAQATRRRILDAAGRIVSRERLRRRGDAGCGACHADACGQPVLSFSLGAETLVVAVLDEGIIAVHRAVAEALSELPGSADPAMRFDAAVLGHLTALHAHSDYTSANVRIFGQVPEAVRAANLPVRRAYEGLWDALLTDLHARGALRSDICTREARLLVLGALNATLEWFDPGRNCVTALARSYAAMLGSGILKTGEGAS